MPINSGILRFGLLAHRSAVQKTETYSGIEGITTQEPAIQQSMGLIVDRSLEHLGST